jgi:hypothetical protein
MLVIVVAADIVERDEWKRLGKWISRTREKDGRVYLAHGPPDSEFRNEWEKEMRGGESIWDQAIRYTDAWECGANTKTCGE